jgi:hypothetical protein
LARLPVSIGCRHRIWIHYRCSPGHWTKKQPVMSEVSHVCARASRKESAAALEDNWPNAGMKEAGTREVQFSGFMRICLEVPRVAG